MSPDATIAARSTPPRRSWFAVWRWPKWVWMITIPLVFLGYLSSAAPAMYLLFALKAPRVAFKAHAFVFYPMQTYLDCWLVRMIYSVEWVILTEMFGEP